MVYQKKKKKTNKKRKEKEMRAILFYRKFGLWSCYIILINFLKKKQIILIKFRRIFV